jgi:hypothetical protein
VPQVRYGLEQTDGMLDLSISPLPNLKGASCQQSIPPRLNPRGTQMSSRIP